MMFFSIIKKLQTIEGINRKWKNNMNKNSLILSIKGNSTHSGRKNNRKIGIELGRGSISGRNMIGRFRRKRGKSRKRGDMIRHMRTLRDLIRNSVIKDECLIYSEFSTGEIIGHHWQRSPKDDIKHKSIILKATTTIQLPSASKETLKLLKME